MNNTPWTWTVQKETAARMLGKCELSKSEVSRRLGLSRRTLSRWLADREFRDRVQSNREEMRLEYEELSRTNITTSALWRAKLLDFITETLEACRPELTAAIQKNQFAAISLALRLQNTQENYERRKHLLDTSDPDGDLLELADLEPSDLQEVVRILELGRERACQNEEAPRAEVL